MKTDGSKYLGFLVTGTTFLSLPVQAQSVPPDCADGYLKERAYNMGIIIGRSIVSQAWAGIDENCDRQEEFKTIIINSLMNYALPSGADQFTICRYSGYVEGMLQGIDDPGSTSCAISCRDEGELIGEISAIAYCQLSLALDGLATADDFMRLPVQFCGEFFRLACDLLYNTVTLLFADDTYDDPETTDVNEGECKRYTDMGDVLDPDTGEPMWQEVWNQVRDIQCSFAEP